MLWCPPVFLTTLSKCLKEQMCCAVYGLFAFLPFKAKAGFENVTLIHFQVHSDAPTMEQRALKNVNDCMNSNIYSYLETSGGKSYNLYLNIVHFFNTIVNQTSMAA